MNRRLRRCLKSQRTSEDPNFTDSEVMRSYAWIERRLKDLKKLIWIRISLDLCRSSMIEADASSSINLDHKLINQLVANLGD